MNRSFEEELEERSRGVIEDVLADAQLSPNQIAHLLATLQVRKAGTSSVTLGIQQLPFSMKFTAASSENSIEDFARTFAAMLVDELKEMAGRSKVRSIGEVIDAMATDR